MEYAFCGKVIIWVCRK